MVVSEQTVRAVKESLPLLRPHIDAVVLRFYDTLFKRYPQLRPQFNHDRQRGGATKEGGVPAQVARLAAAILSYAKHIDNMDALLPAVRRIAHRHICRDVQPRQYDAVAECLLAAIEAQLQQLATPALLHAWQQAIRALSDLFIDVENDLRHKLQQSAGYRGLVEMVVHRVHHRAGATVLSLVPKHHRVPPYSDGQFVGIRVQYTDGQHGMCTMNLCDSNSDCLNISVADNEEKATKALKASVEGTTMWVSVPCG